MVTKFSDTGCIFLNEPGIDYTGGEFVLTATGTQVIIEGHCITTAKGDMLLFITSFRPVQAEVRILPRIMKHGVKEYIMKDTRWALSS